MLESCQGNCLYRWPLATGFINIGEISRYIARRLSAAVPFAEAEVFCQRRLLGEYFYENTSIRPLLERFYLSSSIRTRLHQCDDKPAVYGSHCLRLFKREKADDGLFQITYLLGTLWPKKFVGSRNSFAPSYSRLLKRLLEANGNLHSFLVTFIATAIAIRSFSTTVRTIPIAKSVRTFRTVRIVTE